MPHPWILCLLIICVRICKYHFVKSGKWETQFKINYTWLLERSGKRIQIITGTAAATLPTSSSVCIIFLIRAFRDKSRRLQYAIIQVKLQKDDFTGGNRALNFFFLLGILNATFLLFFLTPAVPNTDQSEVSHKSMSNA